MNKAFLSVLLVASCINLPGCRRKAPQTSETQQRPLQAIDPATTGSISGVVDFAGTPPSLPEIDMTADPACSFGKNPARAETVIVNNGKLQNAFVYVKTGLEGFAVPKSTGIAVVDQKDCRYQPHVVGIMTGQSLRVLNNDRAEHNVHAVSQNNPQWNLSQMPGAAPIERTFTAPELMMPIVCNQHPWMKMYVNVMAHPFFAVTDKQGRFTIAGLPPGDYTLEALHERLGAREIKVHLTAREAKSVDFSFAQQ